MLFSSEGSLRGHSLEELLVVFIISRIKEHEDKLYINILAHKHFNKYKHFNKCLYTI